MMGSVHKITGARQTPQIHKGLVVITTLVGDITKEHPFLARGEIVPLQLFRRDIFHGDIHHTFNIVVTQLIESVTSIIFFASDTPQKFKGRNSFEAGLHS